MNKYAFTFLLVILISMSVAAQRHGKGHMSGPHSKIEQLEKLKLIEVLQMNEDTSVRFFARRSEHQEKIRQFSEKRNDLLVEIETLAGEGNRQKDDKLYKDRISDVLKIEKDIVNERTNFINSLNDILSYEQIAKLLAFEFKFREEIRNIIMERKGMGKPFD